MHTNIYYKLIYANKQVRGSAAHEMLDGPSHVLPPCASIAAAFLSSLLPPPPDALGVLGAGGAGGEAAGKREEVSLTPETLECELLGPVLQASNLTTHTLNHEH